MLNEENSFRPNTAEIRKQLNSDVEEFLKAGGKIQELEPVERSAKGTSWKDSNEANAANKLGERKDAKSGK
jgi:hypothetical protein